jgi:hypothetical protein
MSEPAVTTPDENDQFWEWRLRHERRFRALWIGVGILVVLLIVGLVEYQVIDRRAHSVGNAEVGDCLNVYGTSYVTGAAARTVSCSSPDAGSRIVGLTTGHADPLLIARSGSDPCREFAEADGFLAVPTGDGNLTKIYCLYELKKDESEELG